MIINSKKYLTLKQQQQSSWRSGQKLSWFCVTEQQHLCSAAALWFHPTVFWRYVPCICSSCRKPKIVSGSRDSAEKVSLCDSFHPFWLCRQKSVWEKKSLEGVFRTAQTAGRRWESVQSRFFKNDKKEEQKLQSGSVSRAELLSVPVRNWKGLKKKFNQKVKKSADLVLVFEGRIVAGTFEE